MRFPPPAAARVLDILTVLLVALALAVLVSRGWRLRAFGLVVSLRSWERPLAWAIVAASVRHVFVPTPSLVTRLRETLLGAGRAFARSPWSSAFAAALGPAVLSRAVVYGVGLFALAAIGLAEGSTLTAGGRFLDMLSRWDANWYAAIATHGYSWNGDPRAENPVVFFPAFPMSMRAGAWLTGLHPAYVGFVISLVAFTWGMAYVYRIARDQVGVASPGIVLSLMAWYPFAIFFANVYTEALIMLAIAGAFFHARERQRLPAAAWAFIAGLAKPNGFMLVAPLALMFALRAWREGDRLAWKDGRTLRGLAADSLVLLAPLAGLALYCAYLWRLTGDPLAWLHGQAAWGRVFQGPLAFLDEARGRLGHGLVRAVMMWPTDMLNGAAALFAVLSIVPIFLRLGAPYALLVALLTIPPLMAGGTTSMGRFTSCMFPIFIWLGAVIPASMRASICAVFAAGQAFAATLFFTWRSLF